MEYTIQAIWDPEAGVWTATSDDIPGLVLESGSLDALMERVKAAVPGLLALNGEAPKDIPLVFQSERRETVHA